jgi:hypothetical protein
MCHNMKPKFIKFKASPTTTIRHLEQKFGWNITFKYVDSIKTNFKLENMHIFLSLKIMP